jgi:phosphopantothenoylcysteine decarboxylase / phosphopantothenate---cysteine ligase
MRLQNKKILLGISGCIAAYKACFLVRLLKKEGAEVQVVLTHAATKFVTKTTLETLSNNPVALEMFPQERFVSTHHISYAEWADLIVLAPATGNLIGKIANGIADDLLTTIVMAKRCPVMIAPAMNTEMYLNPIVQENMAVLSDLGFMFVEPGSGELACETVGIGRLEEPENILKEIISHFQKGQSLVGERIVVTAGPTREKIDPVRYLSNFSSGKMGFAIASEAAARGAEVVLISGPTPLSTPTGVSRIKIESAEELQKQVQKHAGKKDILIMAAAVADYRPAKISKTKIPHGTLSQIELKANPDVLREIGKSKARPKFVVGLALEVGSIKANALRKLKEKNLDMIVMNDPTEPGVGFGGDYNRATIFTAKGKPVETEVIPKIELAKIILDMVTAKLPRKTK